MTFGFTILDRDRGGLTRGGVQEPDSMSQDRSLFNFQRKDAEHEPSASGIIRGGLSVRHAHSFNRWTGMISSTYNLFPLASAASSRVQNSQPQAT